jgi:hypothetical protein
MDASRGGRGTRTATLAASALFAALVLFQLSPLLGCLDTCMVDHEALRGAKLGKMEASDARLNTWILAWVQHSLLTDPGGLFDANIFYPAHSTLTQSEHLLSVAAVALPLRLVSANALAIHQVALGLSTFLLALTTFALVRWLTGSAFAATAAGAAAIFMPWRLSELSHIQLLHAQWFPLAWLTIGRTVYETPNRRNTGLLALALVLQVLSSFYLAYFLAMSCAVLIAVLWTQTAIDRPRWTALAAAASAPGVALALIAIPYLRWRANAGFQGLAQLFDSVRLWDALSITLPPLALGLGEPLPRAIGYEVPLAVFALGVLALGLALRRPGAPDERVAHGPGGDAADRRRRGFALGLGGVCLAAFVLLLGRTLELGGLRIPLPAALLSQVVPGFDVLRNPLRWAIVIGLAFPVLAGLGVAAIETRARAAASRAALPAARSLVALALALSLPSVRIPARDAWEGRQAHREAYATLADLPAGPVVELPWPLQPQRDLDLASRYMLGSTLHWKPLANGMSGYEPPSYALVRQIAQRLPHSLDRLRALLDVRWIVLHVDALSPRRIASWEAALLEGAVRLAYRDDATWILEVPDWQAGGLYLAALASTAPRPTTLAGLSRAPVPTTPDAGAVSASVSRPFHFLGGRRIPRPVPVTIENRTDRAWPGFDPQTEGLVRLRYAFVRPSGEVAVEESAALAVDVPARHQLTVPVPIAPPAEAGSFRLRVDLVQRLAGRDRPLAIPPFELDVSVRPGTAAVDDYEPSRGE